MASKLMKKAHEAEQQLANDRVDGAAAGGLVKVVANGKGEVLDLTLAPEVVDPGDIGMLQDLILTALRDAKNKADELHASKLKGVIPPGFGI